MGWQNRSGVYQPKPLNISMVEDLWLETNLLSAICWGAESAIVINAWFVFYDVYIYKPLYLVYYDKIILGLDIYLEHVNTLLYDYELRETSSISGTLIYIFTRFFDRGIGKYRINLLREKKCYKSSTRYGS